MLVSMRSWLHVVSLFQNPAFTVMAEGEISRWLIWPLRINPPVPLDRLRFRSPLFFFPAPVPARLHPTRKPQDPGPQPLKPPQPPNPLPLSPPPFPSHYHPPLTSPVYSSTTQPPAHASSQKTSSAPRSSTPTPQSPPHTDTAPHTPRHPGSP